VQKRSIEEPSSLSPFSGLDYQVYRCLLYTDQHEILYQSDRLVGLAPPIAARSCMTGQSEAIPA
jgi:hypothetical protein